MVRVLILSFLVLAGPPLRQEENPAPMVRFEIQNAGITVEGSFGEIKTTIRFDPGKPETASLEGRVLVPTLTTGIKVRDRHLQGRQYFRSDLYPEIIMQSKQIRATGKNSYDGLFTIRIKDTVREVLIPFRTERRGRQTHLTARFTLNRLDFGLGEESLVLANEVTVLLDIPVSTQ